MAGALDHEEELVWDPIYPSLQAYAKDFDYDLMGQKVHRTARFLADPQNHIERWVREQQMEIIAIGASLMLSVIVVFLYKAFIFGCVLSCLRSLRYFLALRTISKKYKKVREKNDYDNVDADVFAAEAYRKVVAAANIYTYRDKTDMIEYESGRFNWETLRETGLAYQELLKKNQLEGTISKKGQGLDVHLLDSQIRSLYQRKL